MRSDRDQFSRRELLKGALSSAVACSIGDVLSREGLEAAQSASATAAENQRGSITGPADLLLTNGKFVDGRGQVGTALTIKNGRIVNVGQARAIGAAPRTIDLGGRTVVPGFFDAHVHYTRAGVNPGYEARRIERAFAITELQEAIAKRAESVPSGAFITCIGGWNHTQFVENRRPTKSDLDAAAPKHAVYISGTGGGTGAITNSLGRAFLTGKGVMVDDATGVVMSAPAAVAALQSVQTPDDKLRGTADLNRYANSLCLTGVINAGNFEDQELPLRLWRENTLTIRMRPLFPADSPQDVETRARNNFSQAGRAVGDDLFRVAGFGERIGGNDTMSPQFEPTARMIGKYGWLLQQHSITIKENDFHLDAFRSIAREHPIDRLRWSIIHLQNIDEARLKTLKELGAGASAQTWTYMSNAGGPPFRRIVDSGIHAGVGTDSTNVSALDPWLSLFYMTTGRNLAGMLTNDGQQISRLEALRLYTEGAAWFSFDDHQVGSFVAGKYADLAVLSQDYLTVTDQAIRKIESVLTMVAGNVVHATGTFARWSG
ncbi:MAG TPA: amidohydrolase family protein [Vicinamibacterales bacterium]|nr:amidohydrolase family protein [Vicinamibacterales bacterium]